MTHDDMIEVIQAEKEGKQIEYTSPADCGWHRKSPFEAFNFGPIDYRIAKETAEEAAERYASSQTHIIERLAAEKAFLAGVEWQKQQGE